ncbi:MAG: hypothetical protein ACKOMX_10600 [Actinomycetota bacterium]
MPNQELIVRSNHGHLSAPATWLAEESGPSFVVFDNTAGPAGVANALTLKSLV